MIMQKFIYLTKNGILLNPKEKFIKSKNPKISKIISIYNAEPYINNSLLSIENQDFNDIEILMVDDYSKDNSVNNKNNRLLFLERRKIDKLNYAEWDKVNKKQIISKKKQAFIPNFEDFLFDNNNEKNNLINEKRANGNKNHFNTKS